MSALVQEMVRVMHNGAYIPSSNDDYVFRTSPIYLWDLGNRAQDTINKKGQSTYLSYNGEMPGSPRYTNITFNKKGVDLLPTGEVEQSLDSGVIEKLEARGLVKKMPAFETYLTSAYSGGTTLTVGSTTGMPATPRVVEINGIYRRRVASFTATTIVMDSAISGTFDVNTKITFLRSTVETKLASNYITGATTMVVESRDGLDGLTGVALNVYMGGYSTTLDSGATISSTTIDLTSGIAATLPKGTQVLITVF